MIKINVFNSSKTLLKKHEAFLLENMHMNNLMLGILYRLINEEKKPEEIFMSIEDQKEKLILCMSGLYIILHANTESEHIYDAAVQYLIVHQSEYPGIIGPVAVCNAFKKSYLKLTNQEMRLMMNQRIYVNTKVKKVSNIDAVLCHAQDEDKYILQEWYYEFLKITGEKIDFDVAMKKMNELISLRSVYVLKLNNEIVSMAGSSRPFLNSVTVGYVYTPPEHRFKGYATKCVELLTEHLLKTYQFCTLYTDLSNPTSNSIYLKLGYAPIGDSCVYVLHKTSK